MATAKDFNQTAANIRAEVEEARASYEEGVLLNAVLLMAEAIARQMATSYARDNERFDRARFMKACGF